MSTIEASGISVWGGVLMAPRAQRLQSVVVDDCPTLSPSDVTANLVASVRNAIASGNPEALIDCPGFLLASMSVVDYLTDNFAGENDGCLPGLVKLWAKAVAAGDPEANALLSDLATKHAKWHFEDAWAAASEGAEA